MEWTRQSIKSILAVERMLDKTAHGRAKDPAAAMPPMHPCESGLHAAFSQLRVHSTNRSLFLEEKENPRRSQADRSYFRLTSNAYLKATSFSPVTLLDHLTPPI